MLLGTRLNGNALVLVLLLASGMVFATGRSMPLKQVSVPIAECKSKPRSELDSSCKMDLPIITNANYSKFATNPTITSIYSDVRGTTYANGRDPDDGGAPSTDIATSNGTPVYAVENGVVISVSDSTKGYGISVTIAHTLSDGKVVYSSYSHLNARFKNVGDRVKEGELIGEVGKTGFTIGTYGNHLDFAITVTKQKSYPYAYWDCPQGYMAAVTEGACRNLMAKNTVDPILFIQKNGDLAGVQKVGNAMVAQAKAKRIIAVSKTQSATDKALSAAKVAIINEKIYSFKSKNDVTIKIVDMKRNDSEKLAYGGKAYVTIVAEKDGKPYKGYLPDVLQIVSQNKIVGIGGGKLTYINGEATVILYGDGKGKDVLQVRFGDQVIGYHNTQVG